MAPGGGSAKTALGRLERVHRQDRQRFDAAHDADNLAASSGAPPPKAALLPLRNPTRPPPQQAAAETEVEPVLRAVAQDTDVSTTSVSTAAAAGSILQDAEQVEVFEEVIEAADGDVQGLQVATPKTAPPTGPVMARPPQAPVTNHGDQWTKGDWTGRSWPSWSWDAWGDDYNKAQWPAQRMAVVERA